jgi:integrase/recombinase XerC
MDEMEEEFASDNFTEMTGALIIIVFYSTGIRLAELAGIRLGDFSSDFRELKIHGKGGKKRVIPIIEYTQGKVLEYIERIKSENICVSQENYLFLTHKGKPVSRTEIYRIVRAELARAGVQGKSSPHVLRHTFATHMLNDGADIREIQEMLGHSSLSATQIYTHNSISRLKKVYEEAHPRAGDKK